MATSDVEICNSALQKIGAETITTLSDNTRRAALCNRQYDKVRKKLLRAHPWNFAIRRAALVPVNNTISSVVAATDVFTASATLNVETGDRVYLTLSSGTIPTPLVASTDYYVIKIDSTTFKLATTAQNANSGTQIDITTEAAFSATMFLRGSFEYDVQFFVPSDYIRGIRAEDKSTDWKIEGGNLLANESEFYLLYISNITDTTKFDPQFDELFSLMLAHELSYSLVQSLELQRSLKEEIKEALRDARSFDAQEGTPEELETSEWLLARQ